MLNAFARARHCEKYSYDKQKCCFIYLTFALASYLTILGAFKKYTTVGLILKFFIKNPNMHVFRQIFFAKQ